VKMDFRFAPEQERFLDAATAIEAVEKEQYL
jgi:hypothetical protein